jgi:hypothetical protein
LNEESEELRLQLENKESLLINTENALEAEREKVKSILKKRYHNAKKQHTIYIYKNNELEDDNIYTIGKTGDIDRRESGYITHNHSGKIMYAKSCYNKDLLEKVIHQVLDKYRLNPLREWFNVPLNIAIEVVDSCQLLMDEFIDCVEDINGLTEHLKGFLNKIKPNNVENKQVYKNIYNIAKEIKQDDIVEIPEHIEIKNPLDFGKFVTEACQVGPEFYCLKTELYGAHKIWGRNRSFGGKTPNHVLNKYFSENYKSDKLFYEEYNSTLAIYRGVKPKDFKFVPKDSDNLTEYESFIIERCKVGYTYRISYRALIKEFEDYKKMTHQDYKIEFQEKQKFQDYLNTIFYPGGVFLADDIKNMEGGGANSQGVSGITLKSDNTNTGLKLSTKLKKQVLQVNVTTKEIVNTFDSVTEAAKHFNFASSSTISTDIRFQRIRDGCILVFQK